ILKPLPREIAIVLSWNIAREEIAKCIGTVIIDNLIWINDIADRLTHLGTADIDMAMNQQLLWERYTKTKQHSRPNTGVKTQNILADYLNIGWPILAPLRLIWVA